MASEQELREELRTSLAILKDTRSEEKSSTSNSKALKSILHCLEELGYNEREIIFILGIEKLTLDRWKGGKDINSDTLKKLEKELVIPVIAGRSCHPIIPAFAGILTDEEITSRMREADRIWLMLPGYGGTYQDYFWSMAIKDRLLGGNSKPATVVVVQPDSIKKPEFLDQSLGGVDIQ